MGDSKVYTVEDIEKLKQKIASYRDVLTTLKKGNSVDESFLKKSELTESKTRVSNFEEVMDYMNDKQSIQMGEYEQQIKSFSGQIDDLNQTVKALNQDLSLIVDTLRTSESSGSIEKVDTPFGVQSFLNTVDRYDKRKVDTIKGVTQTKGKTPTSLIPKSTLASSYKQLQILVGEANDIQELPEGVTSEANINIQEEYPDEQQYPNRKSFPATGTLPSNIYNGLYRNVQLKSTINLNKRVKKQAIPISVNEIPDSSSFSTFSEPEKNNMAMEYAGEMDNVAPIEMENDPIEIVNETGQQDSIEIVDETKQQEHKSKETLSILNFFRRKQ